MGKIRQLGVMKVLKKMESLEQAGSADAVQKGR